MTSSEYARDRANDFLDALHHLWIATDYPEWQDLSLYTDHELKAILGEWIHVRKAGDSIFEKIKTARPDLPSWNPIQGERPLE